VDPGWQKAAEVQGVAFGFSECGAFVANRIVQDFDAQMQIRCWFFAHECILSTCSACPPNYVALPRFGMSDFT